MKNNNLEVLKNHIPSMPKDERDVIIQSLMQQNLQEMQGEVERIKTSQNKLKEQVSQVRDDLDERITLDYGQQAALQHAKKKRVEELWSIGGEFQKVLDTRRKLHSRAWSELYRALGVSSYRDVRDKDFDEALNWMKSWRPQLF